MQTGKHPPKKYIFIDEKRASIHEDLAVDCLAESLGAEFFCMVLDFEVSPSHARDSNSAVGSSASP